MKLSILSYNKKAVCLLTIPFFIFLMGCKKNDPLLPSANNESADVAHDWYKLLLRIQLHANPPTFALLNMSNLVILV
jgi:hypothetical protein